MDERHDWSESSRSEGACEENASVGGGGDIVVLREVVGIVRWGDVVSSVRSNEGPRINLPVFEKKRTSERCLNTARHCLPDP